ncbi:MAG: hypothetical protein K9G46_03280 [Flavobacteriales bacterium]|nr:hypothetical protein [Flavobacteriales bacterium]
MQPHIPTASVGEQGEDKLLDAVVTVDGVRIVASFRPGERPLWEHPDLKFSRTAPPDSEEVGKWFGQFQGLRFILQGETRWIIRGSLHRFANKGLHNANDFTYRMLLFVLYRLETEFGLCLRTSRLEGLETGLNLHDMRVQLILDSIIWQGNHLVRDMQMTEGDFRGADNGGYFSAYYDKGKHFRNLPQYANTLRIEKKNRLSRSFKRTGIRYLSDLHNPFCLILLADMVLDMWNEDTLFFDNSLLQRLDEFKPKQREKILQWSNPKFWKHLKETQTEGIVPKNKFRQEWERAEKFQAQHSDLKQQISEAMAAKLQPLRKFTTESSEKAGIFTPPSISEHRPQNDPNQGIYIGVHSQPQKEETGNLHSLSKCGKFPASRSSGLDSLTREQLFDALGMDVNDPY